MYHGSELLLFTRKLNCLQEEEEEEKEAEEELEKLTFCHISHVSGPILTKF